MFTIIAGISALSFLVAVACTLVAMGSYFRTPGSKLVGFGFARYFRREKPNLFFGMVGGVVLGLGLNVLAVALNH